MARAKKTDGDAAPLELGERPPSMHSLDNDMATVAARLIANYPEGLDHLNRYSLAYLRRHTERVDEVWDADKVAAVFVISDRIRAITQFDAGVAIRAKDWDRLAPEQRQALMHRSLLKLGHRPKGGLKLLKPDVSEFSQIARIYGPWEDQLKLFAESLDAHQRGGGPGPRPMDVPKKFEADELAPSRGADSPTPLHPH